MSAECELSSWRSTHSCQSRSQHCKNKGYVEWKAHPWRDWQVPWVEIAEDGTNGRILGATKNIVFKRKKRVGRNTGHRHLSASETEHSLAGKLSTTKNKLRQRRRKSYFFSVTEPMIFLEADESQSTRFSYTLTIAPSCFWYSNS